MLVILFAADSELRCCGISAPDTNVFRMRSFSPNKSRCFFLQQIYTQYTPLQTNMEPETKNTPGKGETSTIHQILGSMFALGGVPT